MNSMTYLLMLFNLLFVDTLYKPNINADAKPIYCFLLKFVLKVMVLSYLAEFKKRLTNFQSLRKDLRICSV